MTYTRRLTLALRSRGADEILIADVLKELESVRLTDTDLENEFGEPEDYADVLAPAAAKKRAGPVLVAGVAAAAVWLVIALVGHTWGWEMGEALGPLLLLPAIGLLVAGVLGQFAADYFRRVK